MITNENKQVVWEADRDPFGKVTNVVTNNFAMNVALPGQYTDAETNYNQNWNRDYDPNTGRYLQSDPIGLRGGINTYGYALGNPVMFIDPWGLLSGPLGNGMCFITNDDGTVHAFPCNNPTEPTSPSGICPIDDVQAAAPPPTVIPTQSPIMPSLSEGSSGSSSLMYGPVRLNNSDNLRGCMGNEATIHMSDMILEHLVEEGALMLAPGGIIIEAGFVTYGYYNTVNFANELSKCVNEHY